MLKPPSWAFVKPMQTQAPIPYLVVVDQGALIPALRPDLDEADKPVNASKRFTIRIGDVPIAVESDARLPDWEILPAYRPFITDDKGDVVLGLHSGIPEMPTGKKEIFEELATRVSCCELSFKPDDSAIGFVEGIR